MGEPERTSKWKFIKDKLWKFVDDFLPFIFLASCILYFTTGLKAFKWILIICAAPIVIGFFALIVIFLSSFFLYCVSCLIPFRKSKTSFLFFGEKDQLPWWGALIWLIILVLFISELVPTIIHNGAIAFGLIKGDFVTLGENIDQATIFGKFQAWVSGERDLTNSLVSWGIILGIVMTLGVLQWITKKIWKMFKQK